MKINNRRLAVLVAALDIYIDQMKGQGGAHAVGAGLTIAKGGTPALSQEQVEQFREELNTRLADRVVRRVE